MHEEGQTVAEISWQELDKQEQTRLLVEFGHYQDGLQPSCDLGVKNDRFSRWLEKRGVTYLSLIHI